MKVEGKSKASVLLSKALFLELFVTQTVSLAMTNIFIIVKAMSTPGNTIPV